MPRARTREDASASADTDTVVSETSQRHTCRVAASRDPKSGWSRSLDLGTAGALSIAAHATIAFSLLGAIHLAHSKLLDEDDRQSDPASEERRDRGMEIELLVDPHDTEVFARERAAREQIQVPSGGSLVARVDQDRRGRGGDDAVRERALNFADQDDRITRMQGSMTHLELSQLPRIDTGKSRRSWEDQRASREPMELTFVAMGDSGVIEERRREAKFDPGMGLLSSAARNRAGAKLGSAWRAPGVGETEETVGSSAVGGPKASLGQGAKRVADRARESAAARNAHARPLVAHADPSVPSLEDGRPNDDTEGPQSVSARMAALLHASTSGARDTGDGRGGDQGAGPPGADGRKGPGQTSSPAGAGGPGPADIARLGYIRSVQTKVHPLWKNAFPKWAALEGRGGTAVIAFTVEADGTVSSARVARSSGIAEFDENVRRAVLRGAPFGKLPSALGKRFSMSITFNAPNPAVRPKFSGDGPQ